jgi:hypothetical protein
MNIYANFRTKLKWPQGDTQGLGENRFLTNLEVKNLVSDSLKIGFDLPESGTWP